MNSLYQNCKVKQTICESENHYMKNHLFRQKVWPSKVAAPDQDFLCLFQRVQNKRKIEGSFSTEKKGGFCVISEKNIVIKYITIPHAILQKKSRLYVSYHRVGQTGILYKANHKTTETLGRHSETNYTKNRKWMFWFFLRVDRFLASSLS